MYTDNLPVVTKAMVDVIHQFKHPDICEHIADITGTYLHVTCSSSMSEDESFNQLAGKFLSAWETLEEEGEHKDPDEDTLRMLADFRAVMEHNTQINDDVLRVCRELDVFDPYFL